MIRIYDQLIIFAFLQSLFLLVVFTISPKYRTHISGYMAILIFALFLGLGGKILYSLEVFGRPRKLILLSEVATILFGCTAYLFTKVELVQGALRCQRSISLCSGSGLCIVVDSLFYGSHSRGDGEGKDGKW